MLNQNHNPQLLFLADSDKASQLKEALLKAPFGASVLSTEAFLSTQLVLPQPDLLIVQASPKFHALLWERVLSTFGETPQMFWPAEDPFCLNKLCTLLGLTNNAPVLQDSALDSKLDIRRLLQTIHQNSRSRTDHLSTGPYHLRVQCFGRLRISTHQQVRSLNLPRKARKIFTYLFFNQRRIHKENLARLFWEYGGKSALNSLHQVTYLIRKELTNNFQLNDLLCYQDDCYFLNPDYSISSDWQELQSFCLQAEASTPNSSDQLQYWIKAYQLQSSELLVSLAAEEDFLAPIREKSRLLRQQVKDALIRYALRNDLVAIASRIQNSY